MRCQMVVKSELEKLGLHYADVKIGEADIVENLQPEQTEQLDNALKEYGLQLLNNKKNILVERIKTTIVELVHYNDDIIKVNLSDYIADRLNYDYTYLANIFSEVKGITIEQFHLLHKIERVKELIVYDQLNMTEIAYRMHYSSIAHLSNQFKQFTGLTP
ncbi:MAG: AraC family transcriptional regulator, partial [Bacteroidales bacterium]